MMKTNIRLMAAFLLLACSLSLVSCISSDHAKASVQELFTCLGEGRYEDAASLCHPIAGVKSGSVFSDLADRIKEQIGVTFTDGIEIVRYTGFTSYAYHSSVKGARYELTMEIKIGGVAVPAQAIIVENDDGYGVGGIHFGQ